MNQTKPITRGQMLTITVVSVVIVFLLWNVQALSFIAYPFRLFVTYVHEAGHALAAILTGGEVLQFTVSPDGSGLATTRGGSRLIILPAGYIGAALFGAGLFYGINRFPAAARWVAGALGVSLVIFTVLYARPDSGGAPTAIIVGLLFGVALVGIAWKASRGVTLVILSVLSMMTGLNAVMDITALIGFADWCPNVGPGVVCNDAYAFSQHTGGFIPPALIALVWAAISLWLCGLAFYYGLMKPLLREEKGGDQPAAIGTSPRKDKSDPLAGLKRDKDGNIDWSQF